MLAGMAFRHGCAPFQRASLCSHRAGVSRAAFQPCRLQKLAQPRLRSVSNGQSAILSGSNTKEVLEALLCRQDLSETQAKEALEALLATGDPATMSAFLVLLRAKGETAEEVAGLAKAMRACGRPVNTPHEVLDIVGTGGDGIGSVNISTGATVICAAAGAKVAKHGNRSVSSLCGAADVLEALGIAIDLQPEGVARCIDEAGVGFMFAPVYHPAMKAVVPVRKALKVRTAFNMLGPMLNPAAASYGLIGVYSTSISGLMADALKRMGMKKALVVHSMGLDELTPMGPAEVVEVSGSAGRSYFIEPLDHGIPRCEVEDLKGGDARVNADILKDVFAGARGPVADALNLNAGVALAACEVAKDVSEGIAMAQEVQRSGKPAATLEKWVEVSMAEVKAGVA